VVPATGPVTISDIRTSVPPSPAITLLASQVRGGTPNRCARFDANGFLSSHAADCNSGGGGGGAVSSVFGRTGDVAAAEGDYALGQLSDVTISAPSAGQVPRHNGSAWVNAQLAFTDLSGSATDAQVPDTITLTNLTQITNRSITDTAGTLPLNRGGTNQTAWTPSRCVRVNDAGTALESASGDCGVGGGGGDNVSVNGTAASDADFDDSTPAAPSNAINVRWQKDALSPNNISANLPYAAPLTVTTGNLTLNQHSGTDVTTDLEEEAHAAEHQHGGNDEIATATPGANAIPKAGSGGTLAAGWLPNPSATTLGGVKSLTCSGTDKLSAIGTDGLPVCSADQTGGGGGYATIQDEGTNLTQRATVNFTGAGVACADNAGQSRTDCTITGGGGGGGIQRCIIEADTQSEIPLTNAQITGRCDVPAAATLNEIAVYASGGTPSIILERWRPNGGATADLLSGALATGSNGAYACARAAVSQTCISGITSSGSITISNTALSAGDVIRVKTPSAGGTATWFHIVAFYTLN
ncbi:MAG TPA: hypothetical protein VNN17_05780, partial [Terriglobia bacterium]|nr:hypothetical protein [Terriglobia bacterium]